MTAPLRTPDAFLARLWAMEEALIASGLEPMPEWWRQQISRFYRTGKRRFTVRKGRRVFASTCVAPRLAVAEMLFGQHPHVRGSPPLEYVFLSTKREEAGNRILGVKAVLDLLGERYEQSGQTLTLVNRPAVFKVVTANYRTAVGGTIAFAWADELARWNDDKTGKNPAELVIGTLAPALATLPDAKLFLISSPFSKNDYHAKQFELGDTDAQCVAFGETWVINPSLTEAQTHLIEPNLRDWMREYAAIPSEVVEDNWFGDAIDRAIYDGLPPMILPGVRPYITLDPAFDPTTPDLFGWAVTTSEPRTFRAAEGSGLDAQAVSLLSRLTTVHACGGWVPFAPDPAADQADPRQGPVFRMARRVRTEVCDRYVPDAIREERIRVYSDQFEGYSFSEISRMAGLQVEVVPWTGGMSEGSKYAKCRDVRTSMYNGAFRIPNDAELIADFRAVKGVMSDSGIERIHFPRTERGHCDRLSAVLLGGAIALERSPTAAEDQTVPTPEQQMRSAAIAEVLERRRKEQESSAGRYRSMRRAVFGGNR